MVEPEDSSPVARSLKALDSAMEHVDLATAEFERVTTEAQVEVDKAVDGMRAAVQAVAAEDGLQPHQRDALARRVYWRHMTISVAEIASAFGYRTQPELLQVVGSVPSGIRLRTVRPATPSEQQIRLPQAPRHRTTEEAQVRREPHVLGLSIRRGASTECRVGSAGCTTASGGTEPR